PILFVAARRSDDRMAALRVVAALRLLLFPSKLKQLRALHFIERYCSYATTADPFFFLTHHYYLSRYLTLAQRIDCAITHYTHESRIYGPEYHRAVYESPDGLTLWHCTVDGTRYTLTLRVTEDNRYEGDLRVLLQVDGARIGRISFPYVSAEVLGLAPAPVMFITRNQTDRKPELQR